jgi:hypothetical protein
MSRKSFSPMEKVSLGRVFSSAATAAEHPAASRAIVMLAEHTIGVKTRKKGNALNRHRSLEALL